MTKETEYKTDMLSLDKIRSYAASDRRDKIRYFDSVESTNTLLKQLAREGAPDGLVVVANKQTSGRGRHGKHFESPENKGVYLSMLMRPSCQAAELSNMTAWVAVAMCNAVEAACGIRPGIKWVNDIIMNGKKIAGILTEVAVDSKTGAAEYLITGIGINANHSEEDFSPEVRHVASSLAMKTGKHIDRARLAGEMIKALDAMYASWPGDRDAFLSAYRRDSVTVGHDVRIVSPSGERIAFAEGIDGYFRLLVRFEDGRTETVSGGEVSVRGLCGYI